MENETSEYFCTSKKAFQIFCNKENLLIAAKEILTEVAKTEPNFTKDINDTLALEYLFSLKKDLFFEVVKFSNMTNEEKEQFFLNTLGGRK